MRCSRRSSLRERANDRVKTYSLGMKQRLGVAAALSARPRARHPRRADQRPRPGRDPRDAQRDARPRRPRHTVLVSSHLLREIEAICDHLMMIDHGRIVFQGPIARPARRPAHRPRSHGPRTPPTSSELAALCAAAGKPARIDGDALHVHRRGGMGGRAQPPCVRRRDHAARTRGDARVARGGVLRDHPPGG